MTEAEKPKFLDKLALFVANPTTQWSELDQLALRSEVGDSTLDVAERQRRRRGRNRAIRSREFALLRKLRTGELSAEHPSKLNSSLLTKALPPEPRDPARVRATGLFDVEKINSIEQQLAEQWWSDDPMAPKAPLLDPIEPPKAPPPAATAPPPQPSLPHVAPAPPLAPVHRSSRPPRFLDSQAPAAPAPEPAEEPLLPEISMPAEAAPQPEPQPAPQEAPEAPSGDTQWQDTEMATQAPDTQAFSPSTQPLEASTTAASTTLLQGTESPGEAAAQEEQPPLPENPLQQAAMAFAQGNPLHAAHLLQAQAAQARAAAQQGAASDAQAQLALLDFYRATRQAAPFEDASIELIEVYGRSPPPYRPQGDDDESTASTFATILRTGSTGEEQSGEQHWVCPDYLDLSEAMALRLQISSKLHRCLLDWRALETVEEEALEPLLDVVNSLARSPFELLMWGVERLQGWCQQQTGHDNALYAHTLHLIWQLRLELERVTGTQASFDDLALAYCEALEESPPAWSAPQCRYVHADAQAQQAHASPNAQATQAAQAIDPTRWRGELVGDIAPLLQALTAHVQQGADTLIDCAALDRIDFQAAAQLLSWLMARQGADTPRLRLVNVHRLAACFMQQLGIGEHASIELRRD